jgi:hypothetical protein
MQKSGLAVTAAVVLSLIPAAPPALAAPYVPNARVFAADAGSLVEVGYRYKKKYRRNCNRTVWRNGPYGRHAYRVNDCRSKYVKRYRHGYRHNYRRGVHGCFSYGGFTVCF